MKPHEWRPGQVLYGQSGLNYTLLAPTWGGFAWLYDESGGEPVSMECALLRDEVGPNVVTMAEANSRIVGSRVEANYKLAGRWYPGKLMECRHGIWLVHYDDGDKEWCFPSDIRSPTPKGGPVPAPGGQAIGN